MVAGVERFLGRVHRLVTGPAGEWSAGDAPRRARRRDPRRAPGRARPRPDAVQRRHRRADDLEGRLRGYGRRRPWRQADCWCRCWRRSPPTSTEELWAGLGGDGVGPPAAVARPRRSVRPPAAPSLAGCPGHSLAALAAVLLLAACQGDRVLPPAEDDAGRPAPARPTVRGASAEPEPGARASATPTTPSSATAATTSTTTTSTWSSIRPTGPSTPPPPSTPRPPRPWRASTSTSPASTSTSLDVDGVAATFDHSGPRAGRVTPANRSTRATTSSCVVVYGGVPEPIDSEALGRGRLDDHRRRRGVRAVRARGSVDVVPGQRPPARQGAVHRSRITVPDGFEVAANGAAARAGRRPATAARRGRSRPAPDGALPGDRRHRPVRLRGGARARAE